MHAHEEDIEKYEARYPQGWEKIREQRLAKNPKTVQALAAEWDAWARRVNAASPISH